MSKTNFDLLEILVMHTLQPQHAQSLLSHSTVTTSILQGWMMKIKEGSDYLKRYLRHKETEPINKNVMAHLVAGYESEIINYLNILLTYKNNTVNAFLFKLYEQAIKELENLILFLHLEYPGYFDEFAKIPTIDLLQYRQELRAKIRIIKKKFSGLLTDKILLQILMTPLCQFAGYSQHTNPTYNELSYMKDLVKKLITLAIKYVKDPLDTNLITFLIRNNFNSFAFVDYCTQRLSSKSAALELDSEKFVFLSFQFKKLMQLLSTTDLSLQFNKPSVKKVLVNWLHEEINFLNKQRPKAIVPPSPVYQPVQPTVSEAVVNEKIKTNFSAAELALAMRCLQETKLIEFEDRRSFIKFISQYFTSIGTGGKGITWKSLDSKYSAVEEDTIKSFLRKIKILVEYIHLLEKELS